MFLKIKFSAFKKQFKEILPEFLFKINSVELYLLMICLVLYYSIGLYILFTSDIIDKKGYYDAYFSFDNGYNLYRSATSKATHPLTWYFYLPIKAWFRFTLFFNLNPKIYAASIVFLCAFMISYSNALVYRYLTRIVELAKKESLIITIFYIFFAGNIVLSFTPETFVFSLFSLVINLYVVSWSLKRNETLHHWYYLIAVVFIGGQTITNAPKALVGILFENKLSIKTRVKRVIVGTVVFLLAIIAGYKFNAIGLIQDNLKRAINFSGSITIPKWDGFASLFFGGNILLPSFHRGQYFDKDGMVLDTYTYVIQYVFAIVIFALLVYAVWLNKKNKLVWILVLSFFVDIFLYLVVGLGIQEGFIYGGGWIFIVPMLLGWFMVKQKNSYLRNAFNFLLIGLIIVLIYNNIFVRGIAFLNYAKEILPLGYNY